jgi:hypothetical protein
MNLSSKAYLFQVDAPKVFKLPTLGNHYKNSSVINIITSPDRKYSVPEDRKISELLNPDVRENSKFHDSKELSEIQTSSGPEVVKLIDNSHKQTLSTCSSRGFYNLFANNFAFLQFTKTFQKVFFI